MGPDVMQSLQEAPVVPLIGSDDPEQAVDIARALADGGLRVLEIVLRTDRAIECLQAVAQRVSGTVAGAGTVLNAEQAEAAVVAGARFIVSPGLDDGVIEVARARGLPVFPGVATATEVQRAWNLGLDTVKFFPASIAGGVPALKALSSVFRSMRFMPTGGVSAENLGDYLSIPAVIACGGSWLTPADAIAAGDYRRVTALAREAMETASGRTAGGVTATG